jgi:hypothetical protein
VWVRPGVKCTPLCKAAALITDFRIYSKVLPGTNTLAYLTKSSVTKEKSFTKILPDEKYCDKFYLVSLIFTYQ